MGLSNDIEILLCIKNYRYSIYIRKVSHCFKMSTLLNHLKLFHGSYGQSNMHSINPTLFNMILWVTRSIVSLTRCLMVQVLKIKQWGCWLGLKVLRLKRLLFVFIFVKLWNIEKMNWKDFCKEFCKKLWKKNNAWNVRCLVDEMIVPSSQHIILKIVRSYVPLFK